MLLPSASLIPGGDPTLLLTSAGMVPFKPYYAGTETPPRTRVVTCQKCFRATDIDEVGDRTHQTMFEMLGNFSFGDYFKSETIAWAWEFCTEVIGFDPENLWVTVHTSDDEAYAIWRDDIKVDEARIVRCGDKDNFWGPAGNEGACGPCSEIYYDHNPAAGVDADPCTDPTGRFVEIWNLVFPQFHQAPDGSRKDLPAKGIDTGLGLERLAAIVQRVSSTYETDILRPILAAVEKITGVRYGQEEKTDFALRVITEHSRSATFLIADGVTPSNEGRGYVLRRVIRRAIRFASHLGVDQAFLADVAEEVIRRMGDPYPELRESRTFILKSLGAEEQRFDEAIALGMPVLEQMIARQDSISGAEAFLLYDTYGFPLDLTQEIAHESGISVDVDGFAEAMEAQRERGRGSARFGTRSESQKNYESLDISPTAFIGYQAVESDSEILTIFCHGLMADQADAGDDVEVIVLETPFYPEGGGQVGDHGTITVLNDHYDAPTVINVTDTQRPSAGLVTHHGTVLTGTVKARDSVRLAVDVARRMDIARNHSATHMLHAALRKTLGSHVKQAGSFVGAERLRFDFTHMNAVSNEELRKIETDINSSVRDDLPIVNNETSYLDATSSGALAFFGERYGDRVRTVQIGDGESQISFEVCGGTHLAATGQIGLFHIVAESSVGSGIRRIEAVTGRWAEKWMFDKVAAFYQISQRLNVTFDDVPQAVEDLIHTAEEGRKANAANQKEQALVEAEQLLSSVRQINNVNVLVARSHATDVEDLRSMCDWIRDKIRSGVVVLGATFAGKPFLLAMVTQDLVELGLDAVGICKDAAGAIQGGGGGRPNLAQAGGKDPGGLDKALELAIQSLESSLL